MENISLQQRKKEIQTVTLWGSLVNILLMFGKFVSGLVSGSAALIADGLHSLSDLVTDIVVLLSARISNRPADLTHPYGHKRFETISSQLIAMILMVVGFGLARSAILSLIKGEQKFPGFVVLIVALVSIILKELIFRATRKVSAKISSAALYANAWHHRTDALSSIAVFIGGIASILGWGYADQVAAIAVAVMIFAVGWKIFYEGLIELTEHSADESSISNIEAIFAHAKDITGWHALRTRKVGGELFVDVHIQVDPDLTVTAGHDIATRLKNEVEQGLDRPVNVLVHIEPAE